MEPHGMLLDLPEVPVVVTLPDGKPVRLTTMLSSTPWQVKVSLYHREIWKTCYHPSNVILSFDDKELEDGEKLLAQVQFDESLLSSSNCRLTPLDDQFANAVHLKCWLKGKETPSSPKSKRKNFRNSNLQNLSNLLIPRIKEHPGDVSYQYSFMAGPGTSRAILGYRAIFYIHACTVKDEGVERMIMTSLDKFKFVPALFAMQIDKNSMVARQVEVNFCLSVVRNPKSLHYGAIEVSYKPERQGSYILTVFCDDSQEIQLGGCPSRLTVVSATNCNFHELFSSMWRPELGEIICRFLEDPFYHDLVFKNLSLVHLGAFLSDKATRVRMAHGLDCLLSCSENNMRALKRWNLDFITVLLKSFVWVAHSNLYSFISRSFLIFAKMVKNGKMKMEKFMSIFSLKTIVVLIIHAQKIGSWVPTYRALALLTTLPDFLRSLGDESNKIQAQSLRNAIIQFCRKSTSERSLSESDGEVGGTEKITSEHYHRLSSATQILYQMAKVDLLTFEDMEQLMEPVLHLVRNTGRSDPLRSQSLSLLSLFYDPEKNYLGDLYSKLEFPDFQNRLAETITLLGTVLSPNSKSLLEMTTMDWESEIYDFLSKSQEELEKEKDKENEENGNEENENGERKRGERIQALKRVGSKDFGERRGIRREKTREVGSRMRRERFKSEGEEENDLWKGDPLPSLQLLHTANCCALRILNMIGRATFLPNSPKTIHDLLKSSESQFLFSEEIFITISQILRCECQLQKQEAMNFVEMMLSEPRCLSFITTHCIPSICSLLSFSKGKVFLSVVRILSVLVRKFKNQKEKLNLYHVTPKALNKLILLFLDSESAKSSSQPNSQRRRFSETPLDTQSEMAEKDVGALLAHLTTYDHYKPHLLQRGGIPFLGQLLSLGLHLTMHREIPYEEVKYEKIIGEGASGEVWVGTWEDQTLAFKRCDPEKHLGFKQEEFNMEVLITSVLSNKGVVGSVGACTVKKNLFIAFRYYSNGSLDRLIFCEKFTYDQTFWLHAALDIAKGMTYLHSCGIVHHDLKPANVLVDENLLMSVTDFGSSRFESNKGGFSKGTVTYAAPELQARGEGGKPNDVYSFGVILWELIHRRCPWGGISSIKVYETVVEQGWRPPCDLDFVPEEIEKLINACWAADPESRPTFSKIEQVLEDFLSKSENITFEEYDEEETKKERKGRFRDPNLFAQIELLQRPEEEEEKEKTIMREEKRGEEERKGQEAEKRGDEEEKKEEEKKDIGGEEFGGQEEREQPKIRVVSSHLQNRLRQLEFGRKKSTCVDRNRNDGPPPIPPSSYHSYTLEQRRQQPAPPLSSPPSSPPPLRSSNSFFSNPGLPTSSTFSPLLPKAFQDGKKCDSEVPLTVSLDIPNDPSPAVLPLYSSESTDPKEPVAGRPPPCGLKNSLQNSAKSLFKNSSVVNMIKPEHFGEAPSSRSSSSVIHHRISHQVQQPSQQPLQSQSNPQPLTLAQSRGSRMNLRNPSGGVRPKSPGGRSLSPTPSPSPSSNSGGNMRPIVKSRSSQRVLRPKSTEIVGLDLEKKGWSRPESSVKRLDGSMSPRRAFLGSAGEKKNLD